MRRKYKYIALVILLFLSIGFAILSSNLSIGSSIGISNASFDVHFEDAVIYQTNVSGVSNPVINSERDTVTLNAELDKPGDYVQVSFYVVNAGTIDAQLNEIISTTLSEEEKKYLTYSYQYLSSGTIMNTGDLLRVGQKRKILVSYQYKYDVTDFIDIDSKSLSLSLKYIQPNSYNDKVWTYNYENTYQTFKAPHTGSYKIELWGASGKTPAYTDFSYGAYTAGNIELNKNDTLFVYVGKIGGVGNDERFNGGGAGGLNSSLIANGYQGGGATDIRLVSGIYDNFDSLKSRIMVAGGGGGNSQTYFYSNNQKCVAGGLCGYNGTYYSGHGDINQYGFGGCQTSGGLAGVNIYQATGVNESGRFGIGGSSLSKSDGAGSGGGGGGYFGGGAGGGTAFGGSGQGAGGGSSYISGHIGCVAIEGTSTSDNITFPTKHGVLCDDGTVDVDCSIHNSGKYFTETKMIDGMGYEWKYNDGDTEVTASDSIVGMPTKNGTGTMNGNSGNGYAKITYLG